MHCRLLDKSLVTNLLSALLVIVGLLPIPFKDWFLNIGLFALSGALTNWIAIHMLFEKVPFLYGSGVIQLRFEAFKASIKHMIISEFFKSENIERVLSEEAVLGSHHDFSIYEHIDLDIAFNELVTAIEASTFGGMLSMFGGSAALEPLREPMKERMKTFIDAQIIAKREILFKSALSSQMIHEKIEQLIDTRLAELTPKMVKDLVQNLIKAHLGWLVIWGGVFGGMLGALKQILISLGA